MRAEDKNGSFRYCCNFVNKDCASLPERVDYMPVVDDQNTPAAYRRQALLAMVAAKSVHVTIHGLA